MKTERQLIKRAFAKSIRFPLKDPLWNPVEVFNTKEVIFVFVEARNGAVGVGEIAPFHDSPGRLVDRINDDFAPVVVGEDPHSPERIREKIVGTASLSSVEGPVVNALSGLDVALWDLRGKLLDSPLSDLLGRRSDRVLSYASGGLYGNGKGVAQLKEEIAGYRSRGFSGAKIKVGGISQDEDLDRIRGAREAIGPEGRLMIDALHAYSVPEAMQIARRAEAFDLYWFESPAALSDNAGHAQINAESGIPVCGHESVYGVDAFAELIRSRAVEFVHFDLGACGGITEARKIAAAAGASGLPCTIHAANGVCLFACSVHFGVSLSQCDSVENHQVHQWLNDFAPAQTTEISDGGFVAPLSRPGHGMDFITPEFIDERIAAISESTAPVD